MSRSLIARFRTAPVRFAIALLVLTLSACGGEPPTSAAGDVDPARATTDAPVADRPLPKACALIDADQVGAVLGQPAGLMDDDPENCVWSSQGQPGSIAMFMVQLSEAASTEEAEAMYAAMVGALGGVANDDSGTLSGLGDRAWRSSGNFDAVRARAVVVRKGHRLLVLNLTGMRADSGLDARLEQAARDAVAML
jgi:hypothetical protein